MKEFSLYVVLLGYETFGDVRFRVQFVLDLDIVVGFCVVICLWFHAASLNLTVVGCL